jgi:hypothetical protein
MLHLSAESHYWISRSVLVCSATITRGLGLFCSVMLQGRGSKTALVRIARVRGGLNASVAPLIPEIKKINCFVCLRKIPKTK